MLFSTLYDENLEPITSMISDPDEGLSPPFSTKKVTGANTCDKTITNSNFYILLENQAISYRDLMSVFYFILL